MMAANTGEGESKGLDLRQVGLGTKILTDESRLDILERMVIQQQRSLNSHAETIAELRRRVTNLEAASALYGCDGK